MTVPIIQGDEWDPPATLPPNRRDRCVCGCQINVHDTDGCRVTIVDGADEWPCPCRGWVPA